MMKTLTSFTLIFVILSVYLNSVELLSSGSKGSESSQQKGKLCLDNCQCPNGTACLRTSSARGRKRCQECECRLTEQCIKLSNNSVICDCSTSGYTGEYCEIKIEIEMCPSDWIRFRGRCYGFINEKKNWTEAQAYCKSKGAYLIEGGSSDENEKSFLKTYVEDEDALFWVGATDSLQEGNFVWANNQEELNAPSYYVYYSFNEPADCVLSSFVSYFFAAFCNTLQSFICELDE